MRRWSTDKKFRRTSNDSGSNGVRTVFSSSCLLPVLEASLLSKDRAALRLPLLPLLSLVVLVMLPLVVRLWLLRFRAMDFLRARTVASLALLPEMCKAVKVEFCSMALDRARQPSSPGRRKGNGKGGSVEGDGLVDTTLAQIWHNI
jgi:hypothetical protein